MASLASRYTQISVVMKVHVGALYQFQKSFPSHSARRRLPESARVEVLLWRSFLLSLHVNPASFARPFQSFRVRPATHTIEYDASLTGMGVLVWRGPCWPTSCFTGVRRVTLPIHGDDGFEFPKHLRVPRYPPRASSHEEPVATRWCIRCAGGQ